MHRVLNGEMVLAPGDFAGRPVLPFAAFLPGWARGWALSLSGTSPAAGGAALHCRQRSASDFACLCAVPAVNVPSRAEADSQAIVLDFKFARWLRSVRCNTQPADHGALENFFPYVRQRTNAQRFRR